MLYSIMRHLHNFFHIEGKGVAGLFKIEDGTISLPFLIEGQYFQIEGSILNDGVYQYPAAGLQDEQFVGYIAPMAVPRAFLDLCEDITEWSRTNAKKDSGQYQSESFGGYSYTRATNKSGDAIGWKDHFSSELNVWRKV